MYPHTPGTCVKHEHTSDKLSGLECLKRFAFRSQTNRSAGSRRARISAVGTLLRYLEVYMFSQIVKLPILEEKVIL